MHTSTSHCLLILNIVSKQPHHHHYHQLCRKLVSKQNDLSVQKLQLPLYRHYNNCDLVMEINAWSRKHLGVFGKQSYRVQSWHVGTDCSKYGQQQQGRPNRQRHTAIHDVWSAMARKRSAAISGFQNRPSTGTQQLRYDGAVSCRVLIFISDVRIFEISNRIVTCYSIWFETDATIRNFRILI